jgi:hypothetical protein
MNVRMLMTRGAGFFISADGYAVTNRHVVEGRDTAEIKADVAGPAECSRVRGRSRRYWDLAEEIAGTPAMTAEGIEIKRRLARYKNEIVAFDIEGMITD